MDSIDAIRTFVESELGAQLFVVHDVRAFQYTDRESPKNWERDQYTALGPHVLVPFLFLEREMLRRGLSYLSLLEQFETTDLFPVYFEDDPHWNEAGTQLAAKAILEFCLDEGCFENR